MKHTYFITGISTEVGKTIASAIITEALQADYWKPIQAGELDNCDTKKVTQLVSNSTSVFHPNAYALKTPMSPDAAAAKEGINITLNTITPPATNNSLVIEGAGGLLVPLNTNETILNLIQPDYRVVVVSRHYLGSINHTLLTVNLLKSKGFNVAILFSGNKHESTEASIKQFTKVPIIGRINEEAYFNKAVIKTYANTFKKKILTW